MTGNAERRGFADKLGRRGLRGLPGLPGREVAPLVAPNFLADDRNQSYLEKIPIAKVDSSEGAGKSLRDNLVALADRMQNSLDRLAAAKTPHETKSLETQIARCSFHKSMGSKLGRRGGRGSCRACRTRLGRSLALPKAAQGLTKWPSRADRQIDNLVYELYGLTPEEIQIVEGAGSEPARSVEAVEEGTES